MLFPTTPFCDEFLLCGWPSTVACKDLLLVTDWDLWPFCLCTYQLWRKNANVVLTAVRQDGHALNNATDLAKRDKHVMLTALAQNHSVLQTFVYNDPVWRDAEFYLDFFG